jgi:NTP pyrophosphatase (non-canonical NTP hydrolase)
MLHNKTYEQSLSEFHRKFKLPVEVDFHNEEQWRLCLRLIQEELTELCDAVESSLSNHQSTGGLLFPLDREEILKELADLQYVVSHLAVRFNLPITAAFNRVHQSNLSKLDDNGEPIFREDGKVLKGPNYKAPDMSGL